MAFTEAIRPKSAASSTMGIKKSVVLTIPVPSPKSTTAASSLSSFPTIRLEKEGTAICFFKIVSNTLGAILQPHPAPCEYCVNLNSFTTIIYFDSHNSSNNRLSFSAHSVQMLNI